ncbi:hypothetical protein LWI29_020864 [Acer saccharum]|uniref:FLZ-type domain-containing protein n=1 Tax=Acer saccharum TaxID=4024 RepID=A0AA39TD46_ACESA|nr:hypothetical protein LWI29_020864 [Acer saccharum]KAK1591825.1 hypothetical protein Q3G72_014253 [Acer saccharum]
MVGLSIVLENQKHGGDYGGNYFNKSPQVISKATMILNNNQQRRYHKPSFTPPSPPSTTTFPVPIFLQQCFLCKQTLLPGKDIYMYKGDRGFCSVECRCRQIFMDEEESLKKDNCSFAAMKAKPTSASSSSSSSSTSASRHHHNHNNHRKGTRNGAGGFVY